jgi:hypothetical protein
MPAADPIDFDRALQTRSQSIRVPETRTMGEDLAYCLCSGSIQRCNRGRMIDVKEKSYNSYAEQKTNYCNQPLVFISFHYCRLMPFDAAF